MKLPFSISFQSTIAVISAAWLSNGCVVVGFAPDKEIRTHSESEAIALSANGERFAQTPVSMAEPMVFVESRELPNGSEITVSVSALQYFEQKDILANYREEWEIEDGKALSIGILPGYGRLLFNNDSYVPLEDNNDKPPYAVQLIMHPIEACWMHLAFFAPTISSLLNAPFDDGFSDWAQFGLIGCDRFSTGKFVGETMADQKVERTYGKSEMGTTPSIRNLGATVLVTVDIPAIWYRETAIIRPPSCWNKESAAKLLLPKKVPRGTQGTVTLCFFDEEGCYGEMLASYQGLVANFSL